MPSLRPLPPVEPLPPEAVEQAGRGDATRFPLQTWTALWLLSEKK